MSKVCGFLRAGFATNKKSGGCLSCTSKKQGAIYGWGVLSFKMFKKIKIFKKNFCKKQKKVFKRCKKEALSKVLSNKKILKKKCKKICILDQNYYHHYCYSKTTQKNICLYIGTGCLCVGVNGCNIKGVLFIAVLSFKGLRFRGF